MSQLVLPEDKVERNLNSFRRYRREGNPLVERVYSGETTFSDETIDLFYFYRGIGSHFLNLIHTPRFREDHDSRLNQITYVLDDLDFREEPDNVSGSFKQINS